MNLFKLFKISIILLIFASLFLAFFHTISAITQDLGRHILMGQIILRNHTVPTTNLFSYTYPNFPFINHHWLSEVIYYLITHFFGFNFLLIINTAIILIAFALIFFFVFKKVGFISIALTSILYLEMILERTDIRPEVFSFLFMAIFICILNYYRENDNSSRLYLLFLLIPLELLWTNLHIYFPIGIILIGLFWIDGLILKRKKLNSKYVLYLTITLISSTLATFINPNGLKGALYPLSVFQNYGYTIQENQNIFFRWNYSQNLPILFFAVSVIFLLILLMISFKKTSPVDWFIFITFTIISATAIRNLPLFFFATFIIFAKYFSLSINTISKLPSSTIKMTTIKNIAYVFIFIALIIQLNQIINLKQIGFSLDSGAKGATDFFLQNNLRGPIFNNFDIGSYLEYRLYPKEKVFVDGRPEAYPASFFQNIYIPSQNNPAIFKKIDEKYKFNIIFFSYLDQTPWAINFLANITNNQNWKLIYLDDYSMILIKNSLVNKELINKYAMTKENVKISNYNLRDFNSLLHLEIFFNRAGWAAQQEKIYQDMLKLKP